MDSALSENDFLLPYMQQNIGYVAAHKNILNLPARIVPRGLAGFADMFGSANCDERYGVPGSATNVPPDANFRWLREWDALDVPGAAAEGFGRVLREMEQAGERVREALTPWRTSSEHQEADRRAKEA